MYYSVLYIIDRVRHIITEKVVQNHYWLRNAQNGLLPIAYLLPETHNRQYYRTIHINNMYQYCLCRSKQSLQKYRQSKILANLKCTGRWKTMNVCGYNTVLGYTLLAIKLWEHGQWQRSMIYGIVFGMAAIVSGNYVLLPKPGDWE